MSSSAWKKIFSVAGLLSLGVRLQVHSQALNGVPVVTDGEIARMQQCLGADAFDRVQRSVERWQQPCLDVWRSPVWNSRRLELQGTGRQWEEVLWQLVFREDLTNNTEILRNLRVSFQMLDGNVRTKGPTYHSVLAGSEECLVHSMVANKAKDHRFEGHKSAVSEQGTVSPVPCIPLENSTTSNPATLQDGMLARQSVAVQSTPEEVFVYGCSLRGARFLTATDEIDMTTLNQTLNSFDIPDALKQTLLQNRNTCLDYSASISVSDLIFPLHNELGRQMTFFQCIFQEVLSSCDAFQALQDALGGGDLGDLLNNGTIDDILNGILSG